MRRFVLTVSMILSTACLFAQNSSRSSAHSFHIVKEVKPPLLNVNPYTIKFVDASSNNAIDADEKDCITFTVANDGYGDACNCVAKVKVEGISNGISVQSVKIPTISVGGKANVSIPVLAGMDTGDGKVTISVTVDEPNGSYRLNCDISVG